MSELKMDIVDRLKSTYNMNESCELAIDEIQKLRNRASQLEDELELANGKLDKINGWCKAYPISVFTEPDWNDVQSKLGNVLLTQVSASNMRHVVNGVSGIIKGDKQACVSKDLDHE